MCVCVCVRVCVRACVLLTATNMDCKVILQSTFVGQTLDWLHQLENGPTIICTYALLVYTVYMGMFSALIFH